MDQGQLNGSGTTSQEIQNTVSALQRAGVTVQLSSTAFCVTHQKTFVIDGPTTENLYLRGEAVILSFNMMPSYFGTSTDYGLIINDPRIV